MAVEFDPAELAIANALFASVAEEMGVTLGRSAHSPNIKERRDYSCAVFDATGRLVAQAAHIPVHLGAMPTAVEAALLAVRPEPRRGPSSGRIAARVEGFHAGDIVILNDPYLGGTHLPDITMVSPVFSDPAARRSARAKATVGPVERSGTLIGFVASRAHHADVGGISPGSMTLAEELIQEGVVIPPIKLYERGRLNRAVLDLLLSNMRAPDERRGDLDAQIAAQRTGDARLSEIFARLDSARPRDGRGAAKGILEGRAQPLVDELMAYAERMTRTALRAVPEGDYEFEDHLDSDGMTDEPVPIRVRLTVRDGGLHCDFSGSSPERPSSINAVAAVTRSAVYYVVRCLLEALVPGGAAVPANDGCFRPVSFTLPERSVVNARPPRAVAAGNVETSQRIVDATLGALSQALPDLIPAASQGTMNNVAIGGFDSERGHPYAYYETVGGGAGASPERDGLDAVHTHMTNTMNTPVEALEMTYPFRLIEYAVRRGSGGAGRHRGGDGIVRTYEMLAPAIVTLLTERRAPPGAWGLAGGENGAPGRNRLERADGTAIDLPSKVELKVEVGDRLTLETPGGGGWGAPA